jgi:excisionase family DNA binding protein
MREEDPTKCGLKPSARKLLDLIDREGEAFPRIAALLLDMSRAGVEIDETAVTIAVKLGKQHPTREVAPVAPTYLASGIPLEGDPEDTHSIVYYVLRGQLIKIGTTSQPHRRFKALRPDAILAFEPGGRDIEVHRHRQFASFRMGDSEYFRQAAKLARHISRMREMHGDPDPTWPTTANADTRTRTMYTAARPLPETAELVTADEAAKRLGLKYATVYGWIRRGKIHVACPSEKRRHLYFLDHFRDLKAQSRAGRESESGEGSLTSS